MGGIGGPRLCETGLSIDRATVRRRGAGFLAEPESHVNVATGGERLCAGKGDGLTHSGHSHITGPTGDPTRLQVADVIRENELDLPRLPGGGGVGELHRADKPVRPLIAERERAGEISHWR